MIDTILFDLDGTLINTNEVVMDSFRKTFLHFLNKKVEDEKITEFFGEPLLVTMEREFNGLDTNEVINWYRAYQKEYADKLIREFPGIKEMLVALRNMGLKLVVVTSRASISTKRYLGMFDMERYFDGIISCDDLSIAKPNPEPIYEGLKLVNGKKENSIMVGDGFFDIKCANNAGVKSVLVGWRITKAFNPLVGTCVVDYEINEPNELIDLIKRL